MSSPPGPAAGIGNQTGAALGIVGSILGIILLFLVGLFLLRYVVNIFIDLCILCDPQEARRTTIDFRDKVFSICLRCRRIFPESNSSSSGVDPDNRTPDSHGENPSHTNLNPLDVRLSELSYVDRKAVLKHLIEKESCQFNESMHSPQKRKPDVESANSSQSACSEDCHACSICLQEFQPSRLCFVSPVCYHVFHQSCIFSWCQRNNSACPYCRQSMFTLEQIDSALIFQKEEAVHYS